MIRPVAYNSAVGSYGKLCDGCHHDRPTVFLRSLCFRNPVTLHALSRREVFSKSSFQCLNSVASSCSYALFNRLNRFVMSSNETVYIQAAGHC